MKVQASQINQTIGDVEGNCKRILEALDRGRANGAEVVLFPELALSGYPPEDLLLDRSFIAALEKKLVEIAPATRGLFVAVGFPRINPTKKEKGLCNSAAVFIDGELVGFKDKTLLPTYDVFDEKRFFEPGKPKAIFDFKGKKIAVTICEDAWQYSGHIGDTDYSIDPIAQLAEEKVDLLLNLSSSPYCYQKPEIRGSVFSACARALRCPVVMCNQVGANDQLVFDGHSLFLGRNGDLICQAPGFVEEDFLVDTEETSAQPPARSDAVADLYQALVLGVRDYFFKQGFRKAILGLSGGVDSALVACIAKDALGKDNLALVFLPSRFTSPESQVDAEALAKNLGVPLEKISIEPLFEQALKDLTPHFKRRPPDETEENIQARIRGTILMALSNKLGHILLNTGNKSEMAMGYTTLYGDMCGGLGVLHDVTKTKVYALCRHLNQKAELIPKSILEKAPSAELRPNQTDQDTLPPFDILDQIIEDYIEKRLSIQEIAAQRGQPIPFIQDLVRKMHLAEYKRRQAPIGIRVTPKAFSKGRSIPIVQKWI